MLNIEWSPDALEDADNIIDYIFQHNPTAALKLDILIQESAQHLAAMPYLGRNGRIAGTREFVIHPNYLIVYRVAPQYIRIENILHCRQCYP